MVPASGIAVPWHIQAEGAFAWSPSWRLGVHDLTAASRTPMSSKSRLDLDAIFSSPRSRRDRRRSPLASELLRNTAKFSQIFEQSYPSSRKPHDGTDPSRATLPATARPLPRTLELQHQALAPSLLPLLPHLAWVRRPLECAATASGVAFALARPIWTMPGPNFCQALVRTEACISGAVLVIAPVLFRSWAKMEAKYHDTLECRTVLQTYLIAAGGCLCATLAAVSGNPIFATLLQVVWRGVAARSLWTWTDLGRNLRDTPGWLHASVARWRTAATFVAVVGAASRVMALVAGVSSLNAVATALSSPAVDFLPPWLVKAASTPDEQFRLNASQLALGVGLYAWIAYYMCAFLPYRVLYDEYQDYGRRVAQFWKDLQNGQEHNIIFATQLGPDFPKPLKKRLARMPPGDDRELLRLAGVIRQRSCSLTAVKAAMLKKNKEGKYGIKMTPIEPGDLTYWGSDLFKRLEQQEKRDKQTGWTPPVAPGRGRFKYIRATYARILREIKVELGKTDEEMENDPVLSLSNLMRFDPEAEEGDFDLVMQKQGSLDVAADNVRMNPGGHEMVVVADGASDELDAFSTDDDAGLPLDFRDLSTEQTGTDERAEGEDGQIAQKDRLRYNRDDPAVGKLEDSIRSTKATKTQQ